MSQGNPGGQDRAVTSPAGTQLVPLRPKSKGGKILKKPKEEKENDAKTKTIWEESGSDQIGGEIPEKKNSIENKNISTKPRKRKENGKIGIKNEGHKANKKKKEKVPENAKGNIEKSLKLENVNQKNSFNKTKGSNGSNIFHSLFVKEKPYKLKNTKNPKAERGTDYSAVSSQPRESYADGEPDMNDSNGDDYSIDFKAEHFTSRNIKKIKPKETQASEEIENRLSDSGKIKSRNVNLREFKSQTFALKSPEGSEAQGPKNTTNTNNATLGQEQSSEQIKKKKVPVKTGSKKQEKLRKQSKLFKLLKRQKASTKIRNKNHETTSQDKSVAIQKQTEEIEPLTGEAKVHKPWLLWVGGDPGYWRVNRTAARMRN